MQACFDVIFFIFVFVFVVVVFFVVVLLLFFMTQRGFQRYDEGYQCIFG